MLTARNLLKGTTMITHPDAVVELLLAAQV
jgi:hypothetical protein